MKFSTLRAFEKHLEEAAPNHLSRIYLLITKEDFDRESAEKLLRSKLPTSSQDLTQFNAQKASIHAILEELNSFGFFSDSRVIVIRNAEEFKKNAFDLLEKYFSNPNPHAYLIICANQIHRGTKFYKTAEKEGIIFDLLEEKPWEKEGNLAQRVSEWMREEQKTMDTGTCRFFVKYVGADAAMLRSEVEKLLCYIGERDRITQQDVLAICTGINTENAWQLGDSIFQRNPTEALRIATALLAEGVPVITLLRQIRFQCQQLFQMSSLLAEGRGTAGVQQQFPNLPNFILQKNVQLANQYGQDRLRKGMLAIDDAELSAKSIGLAPELLTERLIFHLTQ